MNRTALKNYAPQARRDFIQAMTDRAAFYGITAKKIEPMTVKGDVVVIGGREYTKAIADKRTRLEERTQRVGFNQTIDAVAYCWFNRFVALRYMELHGYLEHGYRVLSHPEGKSFPEILEHAEHLDLPTLDKNTVIELKLAGNKENELYRLLLLAQCNALHASMPFLFEEINDETELLLPEALLNSDSLITKLVDGIAEEDWEKVEIIGWLYQYFISEKKDEVIGSVVASEDIPAATQLFTPNWIVRYLVHNTLGRKWLATYPESSIRGQMEFYIEPAEQEPEVQAKLKEITPESLNPEDITFLDPACGSGHILVEAYDLFKAIYQERGYRTKDIPSLILQKNLFGFEIDDRAAQLAMFALLMKARADDRRILDSMVQPNITCFVESKGLKPADLVTAINQDIDGIGPGNISQFDLGELVELFENSKTFGSLIQVSQTLANKLETIGARLSLIEKNDDFVWRAMKHFPALVKQANILAAKYDVVVANPPYLGGKAMNLIMKEFAKENYLKSKADKFAIFMERSFNLGHPCSYVGFVTMQSWMFLSSFEALREGLIGKQTLVTMAHLGPRGFDSISGEIVQTTAYTSLNQKVDGSKGVFLRLIDGGNESEKAKACIEAIQNKNCGWYFEAKPSDFKKIPGSPIAYWISKEIFDAFRNFSKFGDCVETRKGMVTADNSKYVRFWHEVSVCKSGLFGHSRESAKQSALKWFPYNKGGGFKRWYGNKSYVVNWENDGLILQTFRNPKEDRIWATNFNLDFIFKPNVNWSAVTSSKFSARISYGGELFDAGGSAGFPNQCSLEYALAFLNSNAAEQFLMALNPTLNFQAGNIDDLPFCIKSEDRIVSIAKRLVEISRIEWDANETSWDFKRLSGIGENKKTISETFGSNKIYFQRLSEEKIGLEKLNHSEWSKIFGFKDNLIDLDASAQHDSIQFDTANKIYEFISYGVGCIVGRYSLDKEGLVYAHSASEGFDPSQYLTFPADDDGIVPLLNQDWGITDDATERFTQFVSVVWPKEHLEENLQFVAESLGGKSDESARDVIRDYFSTGFYKHHLQLYKRRPIYWLFSSGKQKAFQALVYLHRYNEGTLSRIRTEYVIPLQGKISGRIEQLEADKLQATSTSQRKKFQKEQDDLKKQQAELLVFDEKLKNYADQRIKLDLDDGVKVNYAKFGDLLAEVKAITGGSDE